MVIWFIGLSGAGKSTLAKMIYKTLKKKEKNTVWIDGDNIRKGLTWAEHKDLYREHGYEFEAQKIEAAQQQLEKQKIEAEIAQMEERNAERQRVNEARANMSLMEKMALESQNQSMDQVIRARMKYHGRVESN